MIGNIHGGDSSWERIGHKKRKKETLFTQIDEIPEDLEEEKRAKQKEKEFVENIGYLKQFGSHIFVKSKQPRHRKAFTL